MKKANICEGLHKAGILPMQNELESIYILGAPQVDNTTGQLKKN